MNAAQYFDHWMVVWRDLLRGVAVLHDEHLAFRPAERYGRSVGVADMAHAIRSGRPHRCSAEQAFAVLDAMQGVSKELRDMVRALRPTARQFFGKLILPATLPAILTSWKINLSLSIRVVTMAELVGATTGIGYGLHIANELFSVADVFAWTIVLVAILMATQVAVTRIERRVLVWRD